VEYGGLVLDAGLRWDVFDSRALFPVTPLRIFTHPNFNPDDPTNPADSVFAQAESHSALQPRLRASYRVFSGTSVRATYAHQAQAPDLALLLANKNADLSVTNIGTPSGRDVNLAKTTLFELGVRHAFGPGLAVDLAVFTRSKRAEHIFRIVDFFDPAVGRILPSFVLANADTARSVTGLEVGASWRHRDWFAGQASYSLQDAGATSGFGVTRKHNIAGWLGLSFPDAFHRGRWYGEILRNGGLWAQFRFASGLPYLPLPNVGTGATAPGQLFPLGADDASTETLPWVKDLDLRVVKGFRLAGALWSVFVDFRNLFDFTDVVEIFAETGETANELFFEDPTSRGAVGGRRRGLRSRGADHGAPGSLRPVPWGMDQAGAAATHPDWRERGVLR
jgi:outer membrane receptor protein involved in Fe transport